MPPQPDAMRNRWTAYAAFSTSLAAAVILKSLAQRPNFYSAAVYLSQSSANLMIMCNLVFVAACSFVLFLQKMLYGPLRPIEIEQLYEKAWFAVTETCLAMTIFRGEIGAWFLVMFFSLLAGKVWGWIGEGRVEVLEQQQHNVLGANNARFLYTRLALSLGLSVIFDLTMFEYVVGQVLQMARPDMMVMFGFEFAVLTISSLSTATRYSLNLIELGIVRGQKQKRIDLIRKERIDAAIRQIQPENDDPQSASDTTTTTQVPAAELEKRRKDAADAAAAQPIDEAEVEVEGWEAKGRWVFYLDLATDFFKLVVYLSFFFILLIFYGLPLHIMRDVFLTCRSFFKRIGDFLRYRTATRDMNERYPDAVEAEIGREDVCIICREEMRPYVPPAQGAAVDPLAERMRPKKLPCGHVLHFSCLRSWLERQQICPTCRATVVPPTQPRPGAVQPGRAQQPPNANNGRPRVYQFGPLRIGVGAARGNNMFEELEQQLANIPPAPPAQNGNPPQQYGFGIRWDGIRRRAQGQAQGHRHVRGSIEDQLNAAERQIQREVDLLQASMGELQALRNVQAQLTRIRMARTGATGVQQPHAAATNVVQSGPAPPSTVTNLVGDPHTTVLASGSDQLPQGLTLPEGWTMMPLHSLAPQPVANLAGVPVPQRSGMPGPQQGAFMGNAGTAPGIPQDFNLQNLLRQSQDVMRAAAAQLDTLNLPQPGQQQAMNAGHAGAGDLADPDDAMRAVESFLNSAPTQTQTDDNQRSVSTTQDRDNAAVSRPPPATAIQEPQSGSPPSPTSSQASNRPHVTSTTQPRASSSVTRTPPGPRSQPDVTTGPSTRTSLSSNIIPPRQLNATTSNGTRNSSTSPHRPMRSIGSSWGFSGVENDDEDESDDTESSDNEPKSTAPKSSAVNGVNRTVSAGSSTSTNRNGAHKKARVEDLVEDPD